jgi:hypothetical protein
MGSWWLHALFAHQLGCSQMKKHLWPANIAKLGWQMALSCDEQQISCLKPIMAHAACPTRQQWHSM